MHDFVERTGGALALIWAVTEAHFVDDLGAEGFLIELEGFFAAAVEEEVGFDFHRVLLVGAASNRRVKWIWELLA
jgi:hypothetical protein